MSKIFSKILPYSDAKHYKDVNYSPFMRTFKKYINYKKYKKYIIGRKRLTKKVKQSYPGGR